MFFIPPRENCIVCLWGLKGQIGTWLHDKIMVVDLKYGITGGQNISSAWSNYNGKDENFRDTDVLVEGPVINQMVQRIIELFIKDKKGDFSKQSPMEKYHQLVAQKINASRSIRFCWQF